MRFKGAFLAVVLLLFSCTSIPDAINPLKDDGGVDVTAQLGKENTNEERKQLVELSYDEAHEYKAKEIGTIDYSTNFPWWALVLSFMVGILVRPIEFIKDWRNMKDETEHS